MRKRSERIFEILVIDDNPAETRLLREAWSQCEIVRANVSVLGDSKDAIVYLRGVDPYAGSPRPDVIMLDYKMPVNGGIALTEIKGDPGYMETPVVVLTGSIDPEDAREAYRRHANVVFRKPDDFEGYTGLICFIADFWLVRAVLPRP